MGVKAVDLRQWCVDNISPQSWTRIVLKSVDVIRESGLAFNDLEAPDDAYVLPDEIYSSLKNQLKELYDIDISQEEASFS